MLKHAGDYLLGLRKKPLSGASPKELASWTLAYQFGWAPLIEDIGKMLRFSDLVARRQRELEKASSSRGLKRRITLDSTSETLVRVSDWSTDLARLTQVADTVVQNREVWATVRWHIREGQRYGTKPTYMDAFRSALGFNRGHIPITVWKALPWTWAIDWFADISNIMTANYNMIYYKPSSVCIMQHMRSTCYISDTTATDGKTSLTSGIKVSEAKSREVFPNPSPNFQLTLPFLDGFKLSILGAFTVLGIHRAMKR